MIIDTSALLASLFAENNGTWVEDQLNKSLGSLKMSVVNFSEVLILLRERQPILFEDLKQTLNAIPIEYVSVSQVQAEVAATARLEYRSLNFGDCFAYALAKIHNEPILTLDSDFIKTDLEVISP